MAKYRKYSKDFKLQAAKLVTEQGYSCDQAAKRLGTTGWSVRNWIMQFQQKGELTSKEESQPKIYETHEDGKNDIFKYIEVFYNRKRRHASLGYVSPVVYEEMHEMKQGQAA